MKRTSVWALTSLVFCPFVFAQDATPKTSPPLPADVLGPPLVAWSELQKPRPVPQPLPPAEPVPSAQPQPNQPPGSQAEQQPASQAFTGTIVKDGSKYVLKVSDGTTYHIDDQEKAKPYEGKQVKIVGSLDAKTNVLHMTSIEPLW